MTMMRMKSVERMRMLATPQKRLELIYFFMRLFIAPARDNNFKCRHLLPIAILTQ